MLSLEQSSLPESSNGSPSGDPATGLRTSKRSSHPSQVSGDPTYRYYAGYSAHFVHDALAHLNLCPGSTVLDPWNGSGTTTTVAWEEGLLAIGFDLNPAMAVVARAAIPPQHSPKKVLARLRASIRSKHAAQTPSSAADDLLRTWFTRDTVTRIRRVEERLRATFVPEAQGLPLALLPEIGAISPDAAILYTGLFLLLRDLLDSYRVTNPTWLRRVAEKRRLSVTEQALSDGLYHRVERLLLRPHRLPPPGAPPRLAIANATSLPLPDRTIDAIVSSPPYCTRLDYAIATAPELAILGFSAPMLDGLRRRLLGTTAISRTRPKASVCWGQTCCRFLRDLGKHPSKDSGGYYLKTHLAYFDQLYNTLAELARVLKPKGHCVLVVQDSYYKEILNDLPKITVEMCSSLGLRQTRCVRFPTRPALGDINGQARKYRPITRPTECALFFERDAEKEHHERKK